MLEGFSFITMQLIIKRRRDNLKELDVEINKCQDEILNALNQEEFDCITQEIKENLDKVERGVVEIKRNKYLRDTRDYKNKQVRSFSKYQGQSRDEHFGEVDRHNNVRKTLPQYIKHEPRYKKNSISQRTYREVLEKKQMDRKVENKFEKKEWRNNYEYKPYYRSRRVSFRDQWSDRNEVRRNYRPQGERERKNSTYESPYHTRNTYRRERERYQPLTRDKERYQFPTQEPLRVHNQYQVLEGREGEQDFWRSRIIERHKEDQRKDFPPNLKRRRYSFQEEKEEENQLKKDKRERKEKD
ncbi:Hypothetical predicted protein [Pelobates cultripes]|uniref:Uncharacterized protein n=1 Tax=Pelobates cultripes TaxID=61616 RepID=A0AAD1S5E8_PELCU|nr:Hypothetical predicted protein [Pelobates cultripes]